MGIAIWQFAAHKTQVYIVAPDIKVKYFCTCPSLRKAWLIFIDLVNCEEEDNYGGYKSIKHPTKYTRPAE